MNIIEDHNFMHPEDALHDAADHSISMEKVLWALGVSHAGLDRPPADVPPGFSVTSDDIFWSANLLRAVLLPFRARIPVTVTREELGPGVWLEARYVGASRDYGVIFPNESSGQRLLLLYREAANVEGVNFLQAVGTAIDGPPGELTAVGMIEEDEQPCSWSMQTGCIGECPEEGKKCRGRASFGSGGECHDCKCRAPRRWH